MKALNNAVLDNMLTTRFRTWRPVALLSAYEIVLVGVIALTITLLTLNGGAVDSQVVGQAMYATLAAFQLAMILLIMPALTGSAISAEREKKTLDLLLCTQMRPAGIVLGKLLSSCLFMALCVVCSMPMVTVTFLYGGVSLVSILQILAIDLVTIVAVGAIGLFFSTVLQRTAASIIVSYLAVFFVGAGSTFGGVLDLSVQSMRQMNASVTPTLHYPVLWLLNPAFSLTEVLSQGLGANGGVLGIFGGTNQAMPPMWGWTLLVVGVIAALLIWASAVALSPKGKWNRWKRSTAPVAASKANGGV